MDRRDPGWELYRTFLAVLREGSLSGAARALGLAQPTIGRHVQTLEQALRLPLFVRSQHGLAATDAAVELRPLAEVMAATADALQRVASGHGAGIHGTVRISASEIVGAEVLPPILADLRGSHPDLVIELLLTNRVDDLLQRDADIAVRMVRPAQQSLSAQRLGDIEIGLHAHATYLQRCGTPRDIEDLRLHTMIGFDTETAFVRRLRAEGVPLSREMFALRSDSDLAQLAAIRTGFGIGACQVGLARRNPSLIRVLSEAVSFRLETWLAMHEDLRTAPRCRATFDALAQGLRDYITTSRAPPGIVDD